MPETRSVPGASTALSFIQRRRKNPVDAPTGRTSRRGGRTDGRPRPSSLRAPSFAAEETSTARRCVRAACSLYVNNWIQSMNHLRPPSGFVFVLCFVSEGVGKRKAGDAARLGPEYQCRGRVRKHWGYSLRPRGDSELRASGSGPASGGRRHRAGAGRGAHVCVLLGRTPRFSARIARFFFSPPARRTSGEIL